MAGDLNLEREYASGGFLQIRARFLRLAEVTLAVDRRRRGALDAVHQRDARAQPGRQVRGCRQRGFRHPRTVQRDEQILKHGLTP